MFWGVNTLYLRSSCRNFWPIFIKFVNEASVWRVVARREYSEASVWQVAARGEYSEASVWRVDARGQYSEVSV